MRFLTTFSVLTALLLGPVSAFAQESNTDFPFPEEPFSDVAESDPLYEAVEYLREHKILKGYPDGTFKADRRINRAEFVQLATNPLFLSGDRNNSCVRDKMQGDDITIAYTDVDTTLWYAHPVCIASERKLVNGYPDGTFKPTKYISFVEAAKIMSKVFVLDTKEEMSEFWYVPYVEALSDRGAIPQSIDALNHFMTRGEMAEVLYRLHQDKEDRPSKSYSQLEGKYLSESELQ